MSVELLIQVIIAAAPFISILVSVWATLRENASLRGLEQITAVLANTDERGAYRHYLEDAWDSYAVSFLRRWRWRVSPLTRTLNLVLYIFLAVISTAIWNATGFSSDWSVFMVTALLGYVLAIGIYMRNLFMRIMYKEDPNVERYPRSSANDS